MSWASKDGPVKVLNVVNTRKSHFMQKEELEQWHGDKKGHDVYEELYL